MKKILALTMLLYIGFLSSAYIAFANGYKTSCDHPKASAQLSRAQSLASAGKLEEAYSAAGKASEFCIIGEGFTKADKAMSDQIDAETKRLANEIAKLKEKQGDFENAVKWYEAAGNYDQADKTMMKWVDAKPKNKGVLSIAISHFKNLKGDVFVAVSDDKQRRQKAHGYLKDLEHIASVRGDNDLVEENKVFGGKIKEDGYIARSQIAIISAKEWFWFFNDTKMGNARNRAERRGDLFFTGKGEEDPGALNNALNYYEIAENEGRIKSVKARGNELGDAHARKGKLERALKYYQAVGNDAKVEELSGTAENKKEQTEGQRKEKFKKEQGSLEKELGF